MPKPQNVAFDLTPLMQGAIATYELFEAYVNVGFTRQEALQLTLEHLRMATAATQRQDGS